MPNHCYQQVRLSGPRAMIGHLYENVWVTCPEERRFCDVVIPMPLAAAACAHDWKCDNWGTKWDVVDVQIVKEFAKSSSKLLYGKHGDFAYFTFKCWTAWSPPIPVWKKLEFLGISVQASYQDEGGSFEGFFSNGKERSWKPKVLEAQ